MKAIILAGGAGTRLRPLTCGMPKPMTPLFDRPVLEHILLLLRRHGFSDVAVTLQYQPEVIIDYFGDGSDWGLRIHWQREEKPLGTAGGVRACAPFLNGEEALVISGDCICDFDLTECAKFHQERGGAATLLLHREKNPLDYGLVQLDGKGRIQAFLEKPGWSQVFTNLVNTGIYLLSPRAVEAIPEDQSWDFGRDLFPQLLAEGEALYGCVPYGYWKDMGDCAAYLQVCSDALNGRVKLDMGLPQNGGIWAASAIPVSAAVIPPCWIGPEVQLGESCLIGPNTVLGRDSVLSDRSIVQRSVLLGAQTGTGATLYGAILCRNSRAERDTVLNEHTVLGEGATAGPGAILQENVRLWPGLSVPAGARVNASIVTGVSSGRISFDGVGAIRGTLGQEITSELLLTLGGVLAEEGMVAVSASPGAAGDALQMAAAGGAAAAGSPVLLHDGTQPVSASWMAGKDQLPVSLFIQQEGDEIILRIYDRLGLPLTRERQRRIEGALLRREVRRSPPGQLGSQQRMSSIDVGYVRAAASCGGLRCTARVCVPRRDGANDLLARSLMELGCQVTRREEEGLTAFLSSHGGLTLSAMDGAGRRYGPERILAMNCLLTLRQGERTLCLDASAPAVLEELADATGAEILRIPRDGDKARQLRSCQRQLWDAAFAACWLLSGLARSQETLAGLWEQIPSFALCSRELPLSTSRGQVMEGLVNAFPDREPVGEGLRVRMGEGWVWLTPESRRAVLRIRAEAKTPETAQELCRFALHRAKMLDRD